MHRTYVLDTCALLEQENTSEILRNGSENKICIPITVINELDGLLKNKHKRRKTLKVVENLLKNKEWINFIGDIDILNNDDKILNQVDEATLVTNDLILQLKAYIKGVDVEDFRQSNPWDGEEQRYSGFIDYEGEPLVENCFYFYEGKLFHYTNNEHKCINYENNIWNIKPKDIYQNAAFEILTNPNIYLKTIQSTAGTGKSLLSLASALYSVFQKKRFDKIVIIKYPVEIGEDLGFLPGDINEKMQPHWNSLYKLLLKLHDKKAFNKGFVNPDDILPTINPRKIEFLPVNYLRGENLDNCILVASECQNIPRDEMRTILTRMGENVNVVLEGDISQIDNKLCNYDNNGLNWVIKKMKGHKHYAHLHMNCKDTRGPICNMVRETKL